MDNKSVTMRASEQAKSRERKNEEDEGAEKRRERMAQPLEAISAFVAGFSVSFRERINAIGV